MTDRKNRKIRVTLSELANLEVIMPKGFEITRRILAVTFQNGKASVGLLDTIPFLDPIDDLNRLYGAQRVVAGQEAQEKRTQESGVLLNTFSRLVDRPDQANPASNFKTEAVRVRGMKNAMEKMLTSIDDNISRDAESVRLKPLLRSQIGLVGDVLGDYLHHLANGSSKVNLDDLLFERGVPKNLFTRFTTGSPIQLNTPLARFLYPAKIENFFKTTLKEVNHDATRRSVIQLSPKSVAIIAVLRNTAHLRELIPKEVPLDQMDNPKTKTVFNHGFPVLPSMPWGEWFKDSKMIPYKRRVQLNAEGIEELATSQLNRFNGVLSPLADVGAFWQTMLGLTYKLVPLEIGGYKAAVIKLLEATPALSNSFENHFLEPKITEEQLPLFFHKLRPEANFFLDGQKDMEVMLKDITLLVASAAPLKQLSDLFEERISTKEQVKLELVGRSGVEKAFAPSKKKERRALPLSGLTRRAKALIEGLPQEYAPVAEEIAKYLRSFISEAFQDAAVKLIGAAIDSNEVIIPEKGQTDDRSENDEQYDE